MPLGAGWGLPRAARSRSRTVEQVNHAPHVSAGQHRLAPSRRPDDLQRILHAGWVSLDEFTEDEQRRSVRFYQSLAGQRWQLARAQRQAVAVVRHWSGQTPVVMGSSRFGTALHASDVDLYVATPGGQPTLTHLRTLLDGRATYRKTRTGPTGHDRHLFTFRQGETSVDLNFVPTGDYHLARTVIQEIADAFTDPDRTAHTWIKHLTRLHRTRQDYEQWKDDARLHHSPTLRALYREQPTSMPDASEAPGTANDGQMSA
jgi:hypothetical protein